MAPPWLLPASLGLSAVSSLAGGFMSSSSQRSANKQNYKMFQEQNAFNERMYHYNNQYNDPSNQVSRLRRAGLNPALMLGNIQTGTAQGITSASPIPMQAETGLANGIAQTGQTLASSALQLKQLDIAERTASASSAKALEEAQAVKIDNKYKAEKNELEIETAKRNIALQGLSFDQGQFNLDWLKQTSDLNKQELQARVDSIKMDIQLKSDELNNMRPLQQQQIRATISNLARHTAYLVQQGKLSEAQASKIFDDMATSELMRQGMSKDNAMKVIQERNLQGMLSAQYNSMQTQARLNHLNSEYMGEREAREWVKVGTDLLKESAQYIVAPSAATLGRKLNGKLKTKFGYTD